MKGEAAARCALSALVACAILFGGAQSIRTPQSVAAAPAARSTLRVGLWTLWHNRSVVVAPAPRATLRLCGSCEARVLLGATTIQARGNGIELTVGGATQRVAQIWLAGDFTLSAHGETLTMQHPMSIAPRNGVLILAVTLPLESYVERVVASESDAQDSVETMKALAIVARSFALHETHGHSGYDLCDSTHCQLLRWRESRNSRAEAATLATAGETLWFHGQRALAYFGKDCGGRTASPSEVWPSARAVSYLSSEADRYCTLDGGRQWASQISRAELTSALAARGLVAPGWRNLTVEKRGESGRAVTLQFDRTEASAEAFRLAVGESLGWDKIPGTWFEVSRNGDTFEFHGRGWGNGVGLCQKGAAVMGAQGRGSAEILAQYFPGAYVADETTGLKWKDFAGDGFVLESFDAADRTYLPEIERARAEASQRSGLNAAGRFTVRSFAITQAFRDATLEPGWVAGFAQGDWIATQPLRALAARHMLNSTLRHEFLHALIEQQASPGAPLWLREGLAEVWGGSGPGENSQRNQPTAIQFSEIDKALSRPENEAESEAAHRASGWYTAQLLDRYGRAQVLAWLRSGVPAGVVAALIGQR
jgi:stage II sporulation protein D